MLVEGELPEILDNKPEYRFDSAGNGIINCEWKDGTMANNVNILMTRKNYDPLTGRMTHKFPTPLQLTGHESVAVMDATFYNSFFNITAARGTKDFTFLFPVFTGSAYVMTSYTLTLQDGYYAPDNLNQVIQQFCIQNGLYLYDPASQSNVYFLGVGVNEVTYKGTILVFYIPTAAQATTAGFENPAGLSLSTGTTKVAPQIQINTGFGKLLGFVPGVYPSAPVTATTSWSAVPAFEGISTAAPDFVPVSSVIVTCNLAISKYSYPNNTLGQIPQSSAFGAVNKYNTSYPMYAPVQVGQFKQLDLDFYDQDLNPLYFYDSSITITLQLRMD